MADISNVVTVSLVATPKLAQYANPNVVCIVTSETGVLSTAERTRNYKTLDAVAADWGTHAKIYDFATSLFGTSPNPTNAGGWLTVGFWRAAEETIPATAGTLTGTQLSEAVAIASLQSIEDGGFKVTIDGTAVEVAIDGRVLTSLDELVAAINAVAAFTAVGVASLRDGHVILASKTTGASSTMTLAEAPASGVFIGDILGLAAGTGAGLVQGAASSTLPVETKVDAVTAIKVAAPVKGCMFVDAPTDAEAKLLAAWAQASNVLMYDVFADAANLEVSASNPVWEIKLASQTNYRMLWSKTDNRKLAASYMARMHTVDFAAENSMPTLNLKELSVPAEDLDQTTIDKCQLVGLSCYTIIKQTPVVLESGANGWTDTRYGLIALVDHFEIDLFNLLKGSFTKVAQTVQGVNTIVDQCEKTAAQFVRAGLLAPGTWQNPNTFGDVDQFKRNIEQFGYFFLAGKLSDQSMADRQARKAPSINGALKGAGAIHHIDVQLWFEE